MALLMISKSKLKSVNTILKDEKYRGQTASRKDLFEGPRILEKPDHESDEDDDDFFSEPDEELPGELSDESEESAEESNEPSESADADDEGQEEQDEGDRRDKIRQLLAQETQYRSFSQKLAHQSQVRRRKTFRGDTSRRREGPRYKEAAGLSQYRSSLISQRLYDTLLDTRIRLQNGLLALNSLPQGSSVEQYHDSETAITLESAKQHALNLFVGTLELRKVRTC
jgi:protein AATF/BFR2